MTDLEREKAELITQLENTPVERVQVQQTAAAAAAAAAAVPPAELANLREEHQVLQDHLNALRHNLEVQDTPSKVSNTLDSKTSWKFIYSSTFQVSVKPEISLFCQIFCYADLSKTQ
mgnify:CR=1 FL=1